MNFWLVGVPALLAAALAAAWYLRRGRMISLTSKEVLLARTFGKILSGEREAVLEEMRALYHQSGMDVGVGLALGILLRNVGKHQLAIRTHLSLATRSELESGLRAMIHAELSADYLASGLLDRAKEALGQALSFKNPDERIARLGERLYVRLKDWETAYQLVQTYGKQNSRDVSERLGLLRFEQGEHFWEQGQREEAYAAYKKAYTVHAACLPAYLASSRYYRALNKPAKAQALLKKKFPHFRDQEWLALRELMNVAVDSQDHDYFLKAVGERLAEAPDDWRSRSVLGRFKVETGDYRGAAEEWLACLEVSPQTLLLHQRLWSLMLREDLSREVFESYQHQVEKDLVFSDPYECRACSYHAARLLWHCPSCQRVYSFFERKI